MSGMTRRPLGTGGMHAATVLGQHSSCDGMGASWGRPASWVTHFLFTC